MYFCRSIIVLICLCLQKAASSVQVEVRLVSYESTKGTTTTGYCCDNRNHPSFGGYAGCFYYYGDRCDYRFFICFGKTVQDNNMCSRTSQMTGTVINATENTIVFGNIVGSYPNQYYHTFNPMTFTLDSSSWPLDLYIRVKDDDGGDQYQEVDLFQTSLSTPAVSRDVAVENIRTLFGNILQSILKVGVKVFCLPGDQSAACVKPCQPTNDTVFCDANGNLKCYLPDQNGICKRPCDSPQCYNGATCYNFNATHFTCNCTHPWFGPRCKSSPCDNHPCQNEGTCNVRGNSFVCSCEDGYTGKLCENKIINTPCKPNPCHNKGICEVNGDYFFCSCMDGYSGKLCEHEINTPCSSSPCQNEGTCILDSHISTDGYVCLCNDGTSGKNCETKDYCFSQPCANMGKCHQNGTSYWCECHPMYMGRNCGQLKTACSSHPCQNGGSCQITNNFNGNNNNSLFQCHCAEGFYGSVCQFVDFCKSSPCQNKGKCVQNETGYSCKCVDNWTGADCGEMKSVCDSSPCKNDGKCFDKNMGVDEFKCECVKGYRGATCDMKDFCASTRCANGGKCVQNETTSRCECAEHWIGSDCGQRKTACYNSPCKNDGICKVASNRDDDFTCQCATGYRGWNCELRDFCAFSKCVNGGKCVQNETSSWCECTEHFIGSDCGQRKTACFNSPCKNQGICKTLVNNENEFQCDCVKGYRGKNCELKDLCASTRCANGGKCVQNETSSWCECTEHFIGSDCGQRKTACFNSPCKNLGICKTLVNNENEFQCDCVKGYRGKNCELKDLCASTRCANGGKCVQNETSSWCECTEHWIGSDCSERKSVCYDSPCKNQGICKVAENNENEFQCACAEGYRGKTCEMKNFCASSAAKCENGGKCIQNETSFKCECNDNWIGPHCSQPKTACYSSPCKHGGICNGIYLDLFFFECDCQKGFRGTTCEYEDFCFESPCQNDGICKQNSTNHWCVCRGPWTGELCDLPLEKSSSVPLTLTSLSQHSLSSSLSSSSSYFSNSHHLISSSPYHNKPSPSATTLLTTSLSSSISSCKHTPRLSSSFIENSFVTSFPFSHTSHHKLFPQSSSQRLSAIPFSNIHKESHPVIQTSESINNGLSSDQSISLTKSSYLYSPTQSVINTGINANTQISQDHLFSIQSEHPNTQMTQTSVFSSWERHLISPMPTLTSIQATSTSSKPTILEDLSTEFTKPIHPTPTLAQSTSQSVSETREPHPCVSKSRSTLNDFGTTTKHESYFSSKLFTIDSTPKPTQEIISIIKPTQTTSEHRESQTHPGQSGSRYTESYHSITPTTIAHALSSTLVTHVTEAFSRPNTNTARSVTRLPTTTAGFLPGGTVSNAACVLQSDNAIKLSDVAQVDGVIAAIMSDHLPQCQPPASITVDTSHLNRFPTYNFRFKVKCDETVMATSDVIGVFHTVGRDRINQLITSALLVTKQNGDDDDDDGGGGSTISTSMLAGAVGGFVILVGLVVASVVLWYRGKKKRGKKHGEYIEDKPVIFDNPVFEEKSWA